jgi:5,10-methylenetetrahydrofolate reductase
MMGAFSQPPTEEKIEMFDYPYSIELLTPKRSEEGLPEETLNTFSERYRRIFNAGCGASFPDNPMGQPRVSLIEMIEQCGLSVHPEKTVLNLNTFHTKKEFDGLLKSASDLGLKYLLVIRGDGGPALSTLNPESIGGEMNVATSIDLIRYINKAYKGTFITGAAFNQYNRIPFEMDRLKKKIDAGARFVITQPVIGRDPNVERLTAFDTCVVIEAWMSKNVDLLFKSVRREKNEKAEPYDFVENLRVLHDAYPESCVYLSMLSFKQDWETILPKLDT